jgi:hypothetical protein
MRPFLRFCASCAFLRPSLLVLFAAFAGHLAAQPANVQADPTTGALFRPAAATFISGNSLLTTSAAAAAYQPLDADLTSWAAVVRAGGFDTFVATPSSANLATLVTGETGSGALVFGTSPTFTTPTLGAATATSITGATDLTLAGGSTGASLVLGAATTGNAVVNVAASSPTDPQTSVFRVATGTRQLNLGINSATGYAYIQSINTGIAWAPLVLQGGAGGNVLIGTTTDMTGTGGLHVAGTSTASTTTSGALRVGSNVGLSGNAGGASYFGGNGLFSGNTLSVAGKLVNSAANGATIPASNGLFQVAGQAINGLELIGKGSTTDFVLYDAAANTIADVPTSGNTLRIRPATSASNSYTGALVVGNGSAGSAATNVAIGGGNVNAGGTLTVGGAVIHTLSATPASATAAGTVGTMSWDANYIYICTATNTWKRVAIATW